MEVEEELIKHMNFVPNRNSQAINRKNNYSNFKRNANRSQDDIDVEQQNNYDEVEYDLWPEIQRSYN
jgi:hypothetical protein